jgi:hypothetical protein
MGHHRDATAPQPMAQETESNAQEVLLGWKFPFSGFLLFSPTDRRGLFPRPENNA